MQLAKMSDSESERESIPEINTCSSILELIKFVKHAFRESEFNEVQNILMEREEKMKTEIQNLKIDRDSLERSHGLAVFEKLKLEEKLRRTERTRLELVDKIEDLRHQNLAAYRLVEQLKRQAASGSRLDGGGKAVFEDIIEICDSDDETRHGDTTYISDQTDTRNVADCIGDASVNLITEKTSISLSDEEDDENQVDGRRPARAKKLPYWHNNYVCCTKLARGCVCIRLK